MTRMWNHRCKAHGGSLYTSLVPECPFCGARQSDALDQAKTMLDAANLDKLFGNDEQKIKPPAPKLSHADLLKAIGELDGISLESEGGGVAVYIELGSRRFKVIQDGGEMISHHITRTGLASVLAGEA